MNEKERREQVYSHAISIRMMSSLTWQRNQGASRGSGGILSLFKGEEQVLTDEFFEDLNGEVFTGSDEGEDLNLQAAETAVLFPPDFPAATRFREEPKISTALRQLTGDSKVPEGAIEKVAWLRFYAARAGWISPEFDPAAFHVSYNDSVRLTEADYEQSAC